MNRIHLNPLQNSHHSKYISLKIKMNIFLEPLCNLYKLKLFRFLLNNILNTDHKLHLPEDIECTALYKMCTHPHMNCKYFTSNNDN